MLHYSFLLNHDQKKPEELLSEKHLQIIWIEQKYLNPIFTYEGEPIEVISPGIWNSGAGPDFLHAHLKIGEKNYRGAIEIHLSEKNWMQHHHHLDKNYNNVILHLFYRYPQKSLLSHKENGDFLVRCEMERFLKKTPQEILHLIDLDLYPSKQAYEKGKCSDLLFAKLSTEQTQVFFRSAAYWRLEKKLHFLKSHFPDPSLQFLGGLCMALGYKENALPFLDLFHYLWPMRDLPGDELLAIALGCCGFLEDGRKKEWETSPYYLYLQKLWWGKRAEITHQATLKLHQIRPLNHPIRRLSYMVDLIRDSRGENLWDSFLMLWEQFCSLPETPVSSFLKKFDALFPNHKNSHWSFHYTFEASPRKEELPFIGEDLKRQFLMNTYLPLIYDQFRHSKNSEKWLFFENLYSSLKSPASKKNRYLQERFFHHPQKNDLLKLAQMSQGAYQLHHDFCIHFESSCEGCPFIERFNKKHCIDNP